MKRIILFILAISVWSCTTIEKQISADFTEIVQPQKDKISLREKIGQLFFIVPEDYDFMLDKKDRYKEDRKSFYELSEEMKRNMKSYPAGGIVFFSRNIRNPEQLGKLIANLQEESKIPLFIGIDEEGGRVSRIASNKKFGIKNFPSALEVANSYEQYKSIGTYLLNLGFNVDFAPVADVWTNPENSVIGNRAFSKNPEIAGKKVKDAIDGLHEAGIMTVIKHFPGHGDTKDDTHTGTAVSYKTWKEMRKMEAIPFKKGIDAGTDMVMVAHISTPNATKDSLPATLSHTWITERLRNELGFKGIIITDAMDMKAISSHFPNTEAVFMALDAGADIILMPKDFEKVFDDVVHAVETGRISEKRIDESFTRIMKLKKKYCHMGKISSR